MSILDAVRTVGQIFNYASGGFFGVMAQAVDKAIIEPVVDFFDKESPSIAPETSSPQFPMPVILKPCHVNKLNQILNFEQLVNLEQRRIPNIPNVPNTEAWQGADGFKILNTSGPDNCIHESWDVSANGDVVYTKASCDEEAPPVIIDQPDGFEMDRYTVEEARRFLMHVTQNPLCRESLPLPHVDPGFYPF